jgi:ubiquinone/menaquinone biosynthesis C-methylase UbiE
MKGRESGMPEEGCWESFLDPSCIVGRLDCARSTSGIVELGYGYGVFTVPAAWIAQGRVLAFDIEQNMVAVTTYRAWDAGLKNVAAELRNFIASGTGLPDACVDHAMLYNILHVEGPLGLLAEAFRVLVPSGKASIIHWRSDIETPRDPSLAIRPRPEQCRAWAEQAGFRFVRNAPLSCCSYHFGLVTEPP